MVSGKEKYQSFSCVTILRNVKHVSVTLPMYCFITQRIHAISGICGTLFLLAWKCKAIEARRLCTGHWNKNSVIGKVPDECIGEKHGEKNIDESTNQYQM